MITYINVPVPAPLVPEVMAFIAARMAEKEPTPPTPVLTPVAASVEWSEAELRKLWNESGKPMRKALALLAAHGGKPVPGDDIAKALGKTARGHTVAGMFGALGRRLKHRHKGHRPFSRTWNAALTRWEYTMPTEVAALVSQFAKAEALP